MVKIKWFDLFLAVSVLVLGSTQKAGAEICYYTGGNSLIRLEKVPTNTENTIELRGTSKLKFLMLQMTSARIEKKQVIPLHTDGSFAVRFLITTGPGNYKVDLYGSTQLDTQHYEGLAFFNIAVRSGAAAIPDSALNQKVIKYINSVMSKTVGRGECWDVAQEVLDAEGAAWGRPNNFGRLLDPIHETILPGDIIQFRSLQIDEKLPGGGNRRETLGLPNHTAVIFKVLGSLHFKLAHQNIDGKRYVQVTEINLKNKTAGEFWIYRPLLAMIQL